MLTKVFRMTFMHKQSMIAAHSDKALTKALIFNYLTS